MMPRLTKGNTLYGSGASPGIMSCIAGRLLCDTYLCSRDLLKEVTCTAINFWIVKGH
jgi:DNA polymerase alpha subunit A